MYRGEGRITEAERSRSSPNSSDSQEKRPSIQTFSSGEMGQPHPGRKMFHMVVSISIDRVQASMKTCRKSGLML